MPETRELKRLVIDGVNDMLVVLRAWIERHSRDLEIGLFIFLRSKKDASHYADLLIFISGLAFGGENEVEVELLDVALRGSDLKGALGESGRRTIYIITEPGEEADYGSFFESMLSLRGFMRISLLGQVASTSEDALKLLQGLKQQPAPATLQMFFDISEGSEDNDMLTRAFEGTPQMERVRKDIGEYRRLITISEDRKLNEDESMEREVLRERVWTHVFEALPTAG